MSEKQMFALLRQLWREVQAPEFYWQLGALVLALGLAAWLAFLLRRRSHARKSASEPRSALKAFGVGSLNRLAFPLLALVFVVVLRRSWALVDAAHVSLFYVAAALLVAWALIRLLVYVLRQVFSHGGWLTSFERLLSFAVWGALVLHISEVDEKVIEALGQVSFSLGRQSVDLWTLLHGTVTVAVTLLVALWLASLVDKRLSAVEQMDGNVREVLARLTKALALVVALLLSLSLIGIDVTALSVFSGALAVGLGFGLQKIASNYVSGFIILLDRSIRLGNLIAVDDKTTGTVTQITTRYTVVRTLGGTDVIIPNEYLVSNVVRNQSYTDTRVSITTSVRVAYDADLDRAMALMKAAAAAQARVLADPAPGVQLTEFGESGLTLELGFWLDDPEAGTGNVRSDVNLAIWRAFRDSGIAIPYPQRELRIIGNAAPVTS